MNDGTKIVLRGLYDFLQEKKEDLELQKITFPIDDPMRTRLAAIQAILAQAMRYILATLKIEAENNGQT